MTSPPSFESILLTGGTGFVGPLLASSVQSVWPHAKHTALVREGHPPLPQGWSPLVANMQDAQSVEAAVATTKPDLVLHLAAQSSVAQSIGAAGDTWAVNCLGTHNLASAVARHAPQSCFLFSSSSEVYGASFGATPVQETTAPMPLSAYSRSKLAAEHLLADVLPASVQLIVVRAFNHTGPRQDVRFVLPSFAAQIAKIEKGQQPPRLEVGNLDAKRDFLHVGDVIQAYMALLGKSKTLPARNLFNVASGHSHAIRTLLEHLQSMSRVPFDIVQDPARMRPSDILIACGDPSRLFQATGWVPATSIEQTLAQLLDYWRHKENT